MAAAAAITISGVISNTLTGTTQVGPLTATSAAANGQRTQVVLQSGDNTITVPSSPAPTGVIVQLPSDNTVAVKFGGSSGTELSKTGFFLLMFNIASLPASFVLNSASTQTGKTTEVTFF